MLLRAVAVILMPPAGLALAQDEGLLFHASLDGDLSAFSRIGAGEPVKIEGPDQPEFAEGRVGQALVAGQDRTRVHCATAGNLIPATGTVALWIKPTNWAPGDGCFHSFFESGGEMGDRNWMIFYKYYQQGTLLLRFSDDEERVAMATAEDLGWQPGQWHHLAGTWSPKALRIYVDGELAAEETGDPVVPERLGETFAVGDDGWHVPNEDAVTLVDDVRVYVHPLSEGEIRRLALRPSLEVAREPFEGRWRARVELFEGMPADRVVLEVRLEDAEEPALTAEVQPAEGAAEAELDVGELPPGRYAVVARVIAGEEEIGRAEELMRKPEQERVTLANELISVTFDGATGGVLAIEAPGQGFSAREPVSPASILSVASVGWMDNPRFYQRSDVTWHDADDAALRQMRLEDTENGQRLILEYVLPDEVKATVTAELTDGEPVVRLQAAVANARPLWPSRAVRLPQVTFPLVSGLRIGDDATDDRLATGLVQGEERPNPAAALRSMRALQYPGSACVPWQDLFDGAGGVHLTPLTDGTCQLEILAEGNEEGLMTLGTRWWTLLEPGETWTSPVVELGVQVSQWHPVAERFREWALEHTPPREQPAWLAECDGWLGMGSGTYRFAELPQMLETARHYGFFYLQLWSEMIQGNAYYCYFYPNPRLGTVEELIEGIRQLHEGGGKVGFYSNVICFDGGIDQNPALHRLIEEHGLEEELASLPEHLHLPRFYEEVAPHVFVGPDGSYSKSAPSAHSEGGYVDGYWPMDPCSPWWREYLAGWITHWQDEYGADVWYLDSFPVHGYGVKPASFGLHLDHPMSTGEGQIGLLQHIREAGFDGPMLYEGVACAAFMPWTNWCLGTELSFGAGEWSRPEIFCYSFSDVYPVFSGSCNTWAGIGSIWTDLEEPRHEDAANMVFLNGERFDTLGLFPLNEEDPYGRHLRSLVALRRRVRDVIYAGRMLDVLGLAGMPDHVSARVFVRQEPAAAVVTVVDRRAERAPWELAIDTRELPWPEGLSTATLLTVDGEERELTLQRDGDILRLALADAGEVCAVRMEP